MSLSFTSNLSEPVHNDFPDPFPEYVVHNSATQDDLHTLLTQDEYGEFMGVLSKTQKS